MLELPEVELLRRDLEREVIGRRIGAAEVRPGSPAMKVISRHGRRKELQDGLAGARIERIRRSGVYLEIGLDTGCSLVVKLGSKGGLLKTSSGDGMAPHTHLVLSFTIGGQLRLVDAGRTTEAFLWPTDKLEQLPELADYALDPFETPPTWQQFHRLLERRHGTMKQVLADPTFIVGLGDIYSDEILFTAGLRHDHWSSGLSSQDVRRLSRALSEILNEALKSRGTSLLDRPFTDLKGDQGAYQIELKVFEREGQLCRRCRHEIVREKIDGSYSYFCPQCQS